MFKRGGFWKRLLRKTRASASAAAAAEAEYVNECSENEYSLKTKGRKRFIRRLPVFDPDYDVFHLMVVLTLLFMAAYVFGTSIPSWYFLQEPVANFSKCSGADFYITKHEREARVSGKTEVSVAASLWFVHIRVSGNEETFSRYIPYVSLTQTPSSKVRLVNPQPTRGLMSMITFTLLSLGIVFAFRASLDPPGQIFYGLSSLVITTGITAWLLISLPSGQDLVLSTAYDLCIYQGTLSTSLFLQMTTGACGIIAFLFSCILIHLAVMTKLKIARRKKDRNDFNI